MTEERDWADAAEQRVLDAAIALAPDLGWTNRLVARAAKACDLAPGDAELLFPNGPRDLAALFSRRHDAQALASLGDDFDGLKVREKIARLVEARLDAAAEDLPAWRSWSGFLTLPQNQPLGWRLAWESADALWRRAGDTATDENHYSKRAILAGILVSAAAVRIQHGQEEARAYVARRIDNVMGFEKLKAKLKAPVGLESIAAGLANLRYGRRPEHEMHEAPPDLPLEP
jgi:ubiquinone biosynthesis protein COQ9